MIMASEGLIGLCFCASNKSVVPTFASGRLLGTNPIAFAAPARNEAPLLFDVATSVVAGNQVRLAIRVGEPLPAGWVADETGTPITVETRPATMREFPLLPLGGTREHSSHKGYGLALVAETLSSVLSGVAPHMIDQGAGSALYLSALQVEAFTDRDRFYDVIDAMLAHLRTAQPAPGHDRVLYPGMLEAESVAERRRHGIPLHREVVEWFQATTTELGVEPLALMG
jgi:LDH2 family malate/lactate/ureidoglycolate dehydrogenase